MKQLICIYTCEKDKKSLQDFKNSSLYKSFKNNVNAHIIEVYAGHEKTKIINNSLLLNCKEEYSKLSIKTYKMISECLLKYKFDILIKIDCNILEKCTYDKFNLYSEETILKLYNSSYLEKEYFGTFLSFTDSYSSLSNWASQKNIKLNCKADFYFNIPFFGGKFYSLTRKSCENISNYNNYLNATKFAIEYGGVEDVFVSHCLYKYKAETKYLNLILNYIEFAEKYDISKCYVKKIRSKFKLKLKQYKRDKENCVLNTTFDQFKFEKEYEKYSKFV